MEWGHFRREGGIGTVSSQRIPRLKKAQDIPLFLRSFFASGRAAADHSVNATDGLWTLLSWCWSRPPGERRSSVLCRALLADEQLGWRDENDVLDAMARGLALHDPSILSPEEVGDLVGAFLAEGEAVRGQSARLDLRLEFMLPPIVDHPLYDVGRIVDAIQKHGPSEGRLHEHLDAIHPERRPYRGAWRISIQDRIEVEDSVGTERGDPIPITDNRLGDHSRAALAIEYEADFAGYFRLSVQGERAGLFQPAAMTEPRA